MAAITYNELKKLEKAGFTEQQVQALASIIRETANETITRQELGSLDKDLTHEIELSESKIENALKDLKLEFLKEISGVRSEINMLRSDITLVKGLAMFIASAISVAGILFGIIKFFIH